MLGVYINLCIVIISAINFCICLQNDNKPIAYAMLNISTLSSIFMVIALLFTKGVI